MKNVSKLAIATVVAGTTMAAGANVTVHAEELVVPAAETDAVAQAQEPVTKEEATVQEVKNAMEPFADILNRVLKGCGTG